MTEEFILDIEGTGVIKHMTFNMLITWESKETQEKIDDKKVPKFSGWTVDDKEVDINKISDEEKKTKLEFDSEPSGPVIVLQDGVKDWCEATLQHSVWGRCKSLSSGEETGPPELIFGSEADKASFILRWL